MTSVYEQADASVDAEHRVDFSPFGWSCTCGKGTTWPLAPTSRAKAAAARHQRAEWQKAIVRIRHMAASFGPLTSGAAD